jgi:hypothetical protein
MKYLIGFISATILWILVLAIVPMPTEKVYGCSMAEFHPDIPPIVKEECRRLRRDTLTPTESTPSRRII